MRKKKNLDTRLENCSAVIVADPASYRGRWRELFGNDHPLFVEIGCGKGRFILESARRNPEINYLAIEREQGALIIATEHAMTMELPNLRFLDVDAAQLTDFFAYGEVDRIYLNFSDPWPPNRQRKRRLTHSNFLKLYDCVLAKYGQLHFKTDNQHLFEFTLEEICGFGWLIQNISLDLHNSGLDNIMTEYEEKFSREGFRIYRLEASRRGEDTLTRAHTTPRTPQELAEVPRGSAARSSTLTV
jgi:tRNA (guanine-N7-)-methyltransferase